MLNLIRMNLFKFTKMKCLCVMMLICVLISVVFVTESQDTSSDEQEQQMMEEQQTQGGGNQVGITIETYDANKTISQYLAEFDASGILVIMVGIFVSILTCSERESGFLKNLASCNQHKWQVVVARLIPAILCSLLLQGVLLLSMFGVNIIYGAPLQAGNLLGLLPLVGTQLLLHTAFAALILVVGELSRNLLVCILISIFTGLGFVGFLISFVAPDLVNFMILCRVKMTTLPLDVSLLPVTLGVGAGALILYSALSGFIFQKRDIY